NQTRSDTDSPYLIKSIRLEDARQVNLIDFKWNQNESIPQDMLALLTGGVSSNYLSEFTIEIILLAMN
ncbi:18684_t:CDS:2, partial [Gigaspora rosea]